MKKINHHILLIEDKYHSTKKKINTTLAIHVLIHIMVRLCAVELFVFFWQIKYENFVPILLI